LTCNGGCCAKAEAVANRIAKPKQESRLMEIIGHSLVVEFWRII